MEDNHNAQLIAVPAVFVTLSLVALMLRIYSRRLKRVPLYYDDYFAIGSWVRTTFHLCTRAHECR